jgi:AcrR family transcriptional regulator
VPSENVLTSTPDRRTRKRAVRRDALLDLAAELVGRDGVDGLTMAALAESADYATASLYTYFPSRSALLAALQERALHTLADVARDHLAAWDQVLEARPAVAPPRVRALARLWAFSDLFLAAPERHAREFRLQQQLLVTPGAEDTADAASVVPAAMVVLDVPRRLLAAATETGALDAGEPSTDPVGQPLDPTLVRTFAWVVAMNGALMVDGLTTGLPSTGRALGEELTGSLLRGWGARSRDLRAARTLADELSLLAPAAPSATTPTATSPTATSPTQEHRP